MTTAEIDLNLLLALDVLLAEGSVTGAARRLGLSASAMSRTLARLRAATGDPLLVRAGRGLVPTPRAAHLRDHVHALARDARSVLSPQSETLDLATLERVFTLRTSQAFLETLAGPLVAAVAAAAPRLCLRFVPKPDKDAGALRDGLSDLDIGVLGTLAPEIRTKLLYEDRLVGLACRSHPLLTTGDVTAAAFAACSHVVVTKTGEGGDPVEAALAALGLRRAVRVIVPGYPDAMRIARQSNLVAVVPQSCLGHRLVTDQPNVAGLISFALPLGLPAFQVSALWHPRMEADAAHRWLRERVTAVCRAAYPRLLRPESASLRQAPLRATVAADGSPEGD